MKAKAKAKANGRDYKANAAEGLKAKKQKKKLGNKETRKHLARRDVRSTFIGRPAGAASRFSGGAPRRWDIEKRKFKWKNR